jgi:hypothetical protein
MGAKGIKGIRGVAREPKETRRDPRRLRCSEGYRKAGRALLLSDPAQAVELPRPATGIFDDRT